MRRKQSKQSISKYELVWLMQYICIYMYKELEEMKEYGKLSHLNTYRELVNKFHLFVGLLIEHMTISCFFHSHVYWVPTLIVCIGLGAGNNGWVKNILALLDFNEDLLCLRIGTFFRIILELIFSVQELWDNSFTVWQSVFL